jgi:eukaryotic-like serine/threonine-protein kinase
MAVAIAEFVGALQQLPVLDDEQRRQLPALQRQFPDLGILAEELVQRGWLTVYQAKQLMAGKGAQLVLDQYILLDLLGRGGMGDVFKARQWRIKREVAIKLIRRDAMASPSTLERFQREAVTAAKLAHPNVITVFDSNTANGVPFLVMEFIEGMDLAQRVEKQGRLPIAQACDYVRQAALGLHHAHEQGLVHRDIKPHNLMLTKHGVVKVMDLGLARTVQTAEEMAADGGLTGTGVLMGTADYLAPEQAQDAKRVDIRADIYSLGCTLYHLLAGEPPFAGGTLANKITAHMYAEPRAIETLRPDVPTGLVTVLRRMMAKKPAQRYATPAEVAHALEPFLQGAAAASLPPTISQSVAASAIGDTFDSRQMSEPVTQAESIPGARPQPRRGQPVGFFLSLTLLLLLLGAGLFVIRKEFGVSAARPVTRAAPATPVPEKLSLDLGKGVKLDLVRVKAGRFLMGSTEGTADAVNHEQPQHEVHISQDFLMGKHLVTQEQYEEVLGENPSFFSAKGIDRDKVAGLDTRRFPVENVSWNDAQRFCAKVSELTKRRVELPTEAEWEFACRAGTTTPFYCGEKLLAKDANYWDAKPLKRTSAVGSYDANAWGLFDMAGNVAQWCADGWRPYTTEPQTDPVGTLDDTTRMQRGGAWGKIAWRCRSGYRDWGEITSHGRGVGIRVVVRWE